MKLDLSEQLGMLLSDLASAASESGNYDALELIISDTSARSSFIDLCRELREAGSDLALIEFGPVKGKLLKVLSDPHESGDWTEWNVLVSADSPQLGNVAMARTEKPGQHGKKWTEEIDQTLSSLWNGPGPNNTIAAIAKALERSDVAIAARLVKLGLVADRDEARNISEQRVRNSTK